MVPSPWERRSFLRGMAAWGGAALEDAGGRPRRRADWGLAPGAAVDGASRRGRMCWIASVCCCTAENCWAKPSTVSPNSPAWEMGGRESVLCRRPSSLPGWARDGAPGPPWWTSPSRGKLLHQPRVGTILVHLFERLGLVNLQDSHGVQGGGCLARSTVSFAARAAVSLQAMDGRRGRFLQVAAFRGHRCTAIALSTWGMPAYPLATPPSRVVRMEEAEERLLAVKGAIHDFVSSSCASGKKGTGVERGCEPRPAPRNQSSSREGSGLGGLLTSSPILTAARASMAVSSGSGAAVATTPEGGSPTAPSSSEDMNPSPDAAIDILSTDGAPNEMLGAPWDGPAKSPGNRTGRSLREE